MKNRLFYLAVAFGMAAIFTVSAQSELPRMEGSSLITSCGYTIDFGDNVKIGVGTMPDGSFKYIRRYTLPMLMFAVPTENQALENQINAFPRNQSGFFYDVRAIEKRGNEARGYVYYLKINMGAVAYEIDVENALLAGEFVLPDKIRSERERGVIQERGQRVILDRVQPTMADELFKLKALLDEGALTLGEYYTLKQKILEKY